MEEYIIHFNKLDRTPALQSIEDAITAFNEADEEHLKETGTAVLEAIRDAIILNEQIIIPVELPKEAIEMVQTVELREGEILTPPDNMHFPIHILALNDGRDVYAGFTSCEEMNAGAPTSSIVQGMDRYLEMVLMNPNVDGFLFNPWHNTFFLSKKDIRTVLDASLPVGREGGILIDQMDITTLDLPCIVNAANNSLLGGGGVDGAIHRAAGPGLLAECRTLGGCKTGEAKITGGYNLKAQHVIHTVGPIYSGTEEDRKLLRNCYWNCLELAKANDIHAIAFPAISTGVYGYPVEEATEIALKTVSDWQRIHPAYGMYVAFACFDSRTTEVYRRIWAEKEALWNQRPVIRENNGTVEKALSFAMEAHRGASRKGTETPYILHPVEVLQILTAMDADTNLMAVGLLHDTLEDTDATLLDIYDQFGTDVAALVNAHTEDKSKIWYLRKSYTIYELENVNIRQKLLVLADKVANLRSMYRDYCKIGDDLWERFNAPKHMQAWYYGALNDGLSDLQNYTETEAVYWEMTALYKDLFVSYYTNDAENIIYQVSESGESYVLTKNDPQWYPLEEIILEDLTQIARKDAERIEDGWQKS